MAKYTILCKGSVIVPINVISNNADNEIKTLQDKGFKISCNNFNAISQKDAINKWEQENFKEASNTKKETSEYEKKEMSEYESSLNSVKITDVQIPFFSLVILLIEIAFAAIPAMFVVSITFSFIDRVINWIW